MSGDDLQPLGARELVDLGDRPRIADREALHPVLGDRAQEIVDQVKAAHGVEDARELLLVADHVNLAKAIETLVKTLGPDDTLLFFN